MDHRPSSTAIPQIAGGELDLIALERVRRFGGDTLLRELISLFAAHAPARLIAAREALTAADAVGVRRNLHALKSSGAQLGATRIQRLSQEGESSATGGPLEALPALLDAADTELALVLARLRGFGGPE